MRFLIEPLSATHDRTIFSCGVTALDRYLREQAGQDVRKRVAQCYVAYEPGSSRIAGYYTLSAGNVALSDIPPELVRKLPRYPAVPVARVGRLAVDTNLQGERLGAALLWDAATRALRSELAVYALAVDAKDERSIAFYRHLGFITFASQPDKLFLPLSFVASIKPV